MGNNDHGYTRGVVKERIKGRTGAGENVRGRLHILLKKQHAWLAGAGRLCIAISLPVPVSAKIRCRGRESSNQKRACPGCGSPSGGVRACRPIVASWSCQVFESAPCWRNQLAAVTVPGSE